MKMEGLYIKRQGKCENVGPAVIAKRRLGGLNIGNVTKIFCRKKPTVNQK